MDGVTDPWGIAQTPVATDDTGVWALLEAGWERLSAAPLYWLLPAAWPAEHRAWIPVQRPEEIEDDLAPYAAQAGLPPRPRGRDWLLRSPWPTVPVPTILAVIFAQIAYGTTDEISAFYPAALDVLRWSGDAVLAAYDPPETVDPEPLEDLADWLAAGFDHDAARDLHPVGLDRAIAWREAGFSAAETEALLSADLDLTIEEARAFETAGIAPHRRTKWISYGFDAAAALAWSAVGVSPTNARLWRAAGHVPADVPPGDGIRIPPSLIPVDGYVGFAAFGDGDIVGGSWDELPDPPGTRGSAAHQ